MTPTSAATDCLCSALALSFAETCDELAEARHRRSQKDSTSNHDWPAPAAARAFAGLLRQPFAATSTRSAAITAPQPASPDSPHVAVTHGRTN
jgi:hypothetical protein